MWPDVTRYCGIFSVSNEFGDICYIAVALRFQIGHRGTGRYPWQTSAPNSIHRYELLGDLLGRRRLNNKANNNFHVAVM